MIFTAFYLKLFWNSGIFLLRQFHKTASVTVFLFLYLFFTLSVWAQSEIETGTLNGIITDRDTSSPILGASISIVGTSIGGMADEHGEYEINGVPPGTYNIRFLMIGYRTLIKINVIVSPGRITELSVQLEQ